MTLAAAIFQDCSAETSLAHDRSNSVTNCVSSVNIKMSGFQLSSNMSGHAAGIPVFAGCSTMQRLPVRLEQCSPYRRISQVVCSQASTSAPQHTLPRTVAEDFLVLQRPAAHNTSYKAALKRFANSAILAYECGYDEDGFQKQYEYELGQLQSPPPHLEAFDMDSCRSILALIWITIMKAPKASVGRWHKASPVEEQALRDWGGFVTMITKGYFEKRWAWYPIERLQMELRATGSKSTAPAVVSEWAGIVYATLHLVAPQWPSK